MKGLKVVLPLLAMVSSVVADCGKPDCGPPPSPPPCPNCCLTGPVARKLAETWNYFFVNMNPRLALATLTEDFLYFSDSDNILSEGPTGPVPAGSPTYASRDAFISDQPSFFNETVPNYFVNLDIFHDCHKIVLRWVAPRGFPDFDNSDAVIRGIDVLETVSWGGHWKIRKAYSEYNNVAFLADIGRCDICVALQGP